MSAIRTWITRRGFLSCSMGAAASWALRAAPAPEGDWNGPAVVRKVFLGGARAGWPRPDVDQADDVKQIEARLDEFARRNPGRVKFTGGELIRTEEELAAWLAKPEEADVILAFPMITIVYPRLRKIVDTGTPVLQFSLPYAGHDWSHGAALMQQSARFDLIASSDFADLDGYVPLFRTIHHLKHSKVLLVAPQQARPKTEGYARQFGTAFEFPDYLELKAAYEKADTGKARAMADEFTRTAVKVVEPKPDEIIDSFRLDMAIQDVLRQAKANAIAIDCLGGFGRKDLPAYPCIAFAKLNDRGMYGVCECDLESTMTQLLVTSFSGRPGFVSDPVFDTSKNEVIHAHCVSATKLKGIDGEASPFIVRSHLEDHQGVSIQVLAPSGDAVTVARFADAKRFLVSTGEALGNVDNERGCRTKIRTRVKDGRKLLEGWSAALTAGGNMPGTRDLLHRVVFYGDHTAPVERLGRLLGFKVVNEG